MLGDGTKAKLINDLSVASPAGALSRRRIPGHWQVIDYQIGEFDGKLISAGPETNAPPVTIPLDVSGWHAIYIGFWAPRWTAPYLVQVKLTSEEHYVHWEPEEPHNSQIFERFWKYAEIQPGDQLELAALNRGYPRSSASVAFVKLVPLSETEVQTITADRANPENKRLIALHDAFSEFNQFNPTTAEEIEGWLEPFRYTDVSKLYWCVGAGGDVVNYDSRIGKVIGQNTADYPRIGDRLNAESLAVMHKQGIDPMRVARNMVKSMGIEFHVSQRMEAFACSPPFEEFFTGWAYNEHPEWYCIDRDGTPVVRLSYAFEGFRRLILDIFKEVAAYDIDGVHMIFNRGAPFVLYETPLVEGFMAEYGEDPRELDERDPRWLKFRAHTMTAFVRQLRQEMDALGPNSSGNKLQISAHVLNDEATNLFFGLDLADWVAEGLIDNLIAYPWRGTASDIIDVDYFAQLCNGSGTKWFIELMPRQIEPEEYLTLAQRIYGAGADGLSMWDTDQRHKAWRRWAVGSRLGHRDTLGSIEPDDTGAVDHELISIGGYRVDRYPPHWTY